MDSREYWEMRALLQEQAAKEKGSKFLKDLAKMYNISLKEIQKDIEKWFKRYAKEEGITLAEAQKRLTSSETIGYQLAMEEVIDEAENESFQKYLKHKYMSERITRLDSLKNQVSVQLEILAKSKDVQTFEYLKDTYTDNVFLNKKVVDIESTFHKFSNTAIEETVLKPWSGKSFSDRIWTDTAKLIDEVQEVLSVGLIQGHDIDKMSKKIARRMEVSQNRAKTLVRTETNYILSQATFDTYENFEVEQYEFLATLDYKTSEICQSLDKKLFFVKDRQVGVNCNPMHPNCRSTTIPAFEDGVEGMRIAKGADGKSYHIKDSISYKEWYNSLSTEERKQLEVLKKMDKNKIADKQQYEKYKAIYGKKEFPTLVKFQEIKYDDSETWVKYKQEKQLVLNKTEYKPQFFGKFGNKEVRLWYKEQDSKIPDLIDKTKSLEEQAKQACELRNKYKQQARDMMKNQELRKYLDQQEKLKSFDELVLHKKEKYGLTNEEAYTDIIRSSTTTNKKYDKLARLEE